MDFDFNGIQEVIDEFDITTSECGKLFKAIGENYETLEDFLSNNNSYIVFNDYNFSDGYLRLCRIGALACLNMLNKGYREPFQHWIDFDVLEQNLKEEFYEFNFISDFGYEETIFIYTIDD